MKAEPTSTSRSALTPGGGVSPSLVTAATDPSAPNHTLPGKTASSSPGVNGATVPASAKVISRSSGVRGDPLERMTVVRRRPRYTVAVAGRSLTTPPVVPEPRRKAEREIGLGNRGVVGLRERRPVVRHGGIAVRVGRDDLAQHHHGRPPRVEQGF